MITQIQLGNIFSQNDKTILSGGQSGLDIESLVNGLVEARRQPAVILESTLEANATRSEAVGEMRTILDNFRDAANFLRNPPGVNNESENIFEFRSGSVQSNTAIAGSNYMTITAEPGATATNYDMEITQLATRSVYTTNTFNLTNADTAVVGAGLPFSAGSIFLGADGVEVELEDGDTLNQIEAKINASKNLSGVEAIAIKVADGQYRLSFKSIETGNPFSGVPTTPPAPPPVITTDAIFRFDANDIDGDGDYTNNPTADQPVANPVDGSGGTSISAVGGTPVLDVNGAANGQAAFDFSGGGVYQPANSGAINTGTYQEKSMTFSFTTGADVSGTQVIYEQGGTARSYSLQIMDNAGTPTLFAVAHNTTGEWSAGNEFKVLNLGAVSANTSYNVVVNFDATANPAANDPANTFTGFVNGVQMDQVTGIAEMRPHNGSVGIGGAVGGLGLADGTTSGATHQFNGKISEIAMFNKALTPAEINDINTYYEDKFNQPIAPAGGNITVTGASFAGVGFAIQEDAQNAIVQFDGTTIERQTNNINDIVEGVTFNLLNETPVGTELEVEIEPDLELARQGILNFVDAYNEFRLFASKQSEIGSNGRPKDSAVLAGSSTLTLTNSRINAEMASIVQGILGDDPSRLADIGIEFSDFPGDNETPFTRNILVLDEATLDAALQADFNAVRKVFEFDYTSDDPDLQVFQRTNGLNISEINLNLDQTNGIYQASYTDSNGVIQTIDLEADTLDGTPGVVLKGLQGTVLAGLTMIYGTDDDATINLRLSQGIGDRIYNTLDETLDRNTGIVGVAQRNIETENERLETDIARIDEQLERYRQQLLDQYAALEAAISSANTILQTLDAQANAARNN